MGIRSAITGFFDGLRKSEIPVVPGLNVAPQHPISVVSGQGVGNIRAVDTNKLPGSEDIPGSWSRAWMGPGRPFVATQENQYRADERETEPRTFQYLASVNSTITPRIAYGLTAFSELKNYAEVVPEVALAYTIPSEELKSFIPTLVDKDGNEVDIPELKWMVEYPDRVNPWSTWLSRFLYNVQIYDAPALYKIRLPKPELSKGHPNPELVNYRDGESTVPYIRWCCSNCDEINFYDYVDKSTICTKCGTDIAKNDLNKLLGKTRLSKINKANGERIILKYKAPLEIDGVQKLESDNVAVHYHVEQPIVGLRIIDGSTIFPLVNESGEQPMPPAPAFTQVLWGVPRMYMNTNQLWYRPRFLRVDAPYGWTFIERAIKPVILLSNLWDYEGAKYTVGTLPEAAYSVPGDWKSADQILEFEEAFNARMAGNTKERAGRARFFPSGTEMLATKEMTFNQDTYDAARNSVLIAAGIPKSEIGEAPEGMLGGKSYAEAMNSSFYRMCISPLQTFVESAFNETIRENGYTGVYFKLKFPNESIDPEKEEQKFSDRFTNGGITRNEYRESIGLSPIDGEEGEYLYTPGKQGAEGDPAMDDAFGNLFTDKVRKPVKVVKNEQKIKVMKVAELPMVATGLVDTEGIMPEPPKPNIVGINLEALTDLAQRAGIDIGQFSPDTIMQGIKEEMEHIDTVNGDMLTVARIVADHLKEDPLYYDKLKIAMSKITGVDLDDDWYLNAPVTIRDDIDMPHQGANHSKIVGIGGVGQKIRPAVWKPVTGEDESLQKWVGGELYRRSEAVYLLDRELAKDSNHYVVPVTWCDKVDGVPGSVQYYIQGRREKELASSYGPTYVEHAAVLDFITGQVDRVNKNFLTHPTDDNRPILIDNDLSFPSIPVAIRSSFVDSWLNKDLSPDTLDSIYLILGNNDLWVDLEECVGDHVAVQGAKDRAAYLLEYRKIPAEIMQGKEMLEVVDQKGE